jgi:protoporphyrinogen oxidase
MSGKAIVIGAGPAGLTAAYEMLHRTDVQPVIFEMTDAIGGISRTVNYQGNRIDIGGHRFFSKSARVMDWWLRILPLQGAPARDDLALGREVALSPEPDAPDPEKTDRVMLTRTRLSRVLFERRFYDYPISLSARTVANLGLRRTARIGASYLKTRAAPIRHERSLEDFLINRFGTALYRTFFRDYTEKVWGVPCTAISPEWGAQRIKGLSIRKAVTDALRSAFAKDSSIAQKDTETTLIKRFLYPKFGPGQMWEEVARIVTDKGGRIQQNHKVVALRAQGNRIVEVTAQHVETGRRTTHAADYVFSTMPVKELVAALEPAAPPEVRDVAAGLVYRDFITVGLLARKLKLGTPSRARTPNALIPDNWIYIQEKDVKVGRLQIFNNWSPYMVRDENTAWIGLEYFCNQNDALWNLSDAELISLAVEEMTRIGVLDGQDVLDGVAIRTPNTYPAYFGTYDRFDLIRNFVEPFENLFLIGRNGMHRYNNQDHSMLTAMTAVENIISGRRDKANIWAVNTERDYHEADARRRDESREERNRQ